MTDSDAFVRQLPKAELHVHIEGTLEPELAFELAARNKVQLPYADVEALRRAYRFEDLQSFLDIYYANCAVLRTEQDFYDLAHAYLSKAATQGVRHAEVFFDPQTHTERGVSFETCCMGIRRALVRRRGGARDLVGPDPVLPARPQRGGRAADAGGSPALRRAPAGRRPRLRRGRQPSGQVRGASSGRPGRWACPGVAHAGEEGPPEYIWEALDVLEARRIDHGVRCLEDDRLVARLAAEQIPLTVCPFSNVKLQVFPSLQQHDLPALVRRGLLVTINSDDPAYFGGYVADNSRRGGRRVRPPAPTRSPSWRAIRFVRRSCRTRSRPGISTRSTATSDPQAKRRATASASAR